MNYAMDNGKSVTINIKKGSGAMEVVHFLFYIFLNAIAKR